jgi:hypothetical protein
MSDEALSPQGRQQESGICGLSGAGRSAPAHRRFRDAV